MIADCASPTTDVAETIGQTSWLAGCGQSTCLVTTTSLTYAALDNCTLRGQARSSTASPLIHTYPNLRENSSRDVVGG